MIELQLQRYVGCLWLNVGEPDFAHDDAEDAEETAVHWLAEIYCGSYPVDWPGPYRVMVEDTAVTMDHRLFGRFCEEESDAAREQAEEARCEERMGK